MKPFEGQGTKLRRKISGSIRAKTFISMLVLLVACCIIIYGMVMVFLPKNYQSELESQATSDFYDLVAQVEQNGWEESSDRIFQFSMRNHASVKISDERGNELFGVNVASAENMPSTSSPQMSCSASFQQGGQTLQIYADISLVAVAQSYDVLLKLIPLIAAAILLISIIGAVVCSRYYSKPLVDISNVAKRMTNLDMTWKCDINRKDEIGVLAVSLNEMSQRLSDALDSLRTANEQLQLDIEREREQEKQRIDFFTAVSHELKTPLAIIRGELEGMVYQVGEYKDREYYLRHCMKITDDMGEIIKDILTAARMGGSDFHMERMELDISRMIEKACQKFRGRMEDKGMELRLNIQPDFHYKGNGQLMEKIFSNVLSNAVTYSPAGAAVTVSLQDGVFSVENTGVHIEEEDLAQLFTPFYRVDKSRNRNSGGSGLGLYIVKTILDHHGMAYRMENTEDGVCFRAVFGKI